MQLHLLTAPPNMHAAGDWLQGPYIYALVGRLGLEVKQLGSSSLHVPAYLEQGAMLPSSASDTPDQPHAMLHAPQYEHYGYKVGDIGRLFIAGFGSSMVFGTVRERGGRMLRSRWPVCCPTNQV